MVCMRVVIRNYVRLVRVKKLKLKEELTYADLVCHCIYTFFHSILSV